MTVFEAPPESDVVRWRVSDSPTLVIDAEDGAESGPLFFITAAHRFDDGSLVIASSGTDELRYYSGDGALQQVVGGEGDGPEEFGSLRFVQEARDSLWVYDVGHSRMAVLDRSAKFGRLFSLHGTNDRLVRAVAVFEDGSLLLTRSGPLSSIKPGPRTVTDQVLVRHPDGSTAEARQVFIFESYWHDMGDGGIVDSGLPFGRVGLLAAHGQDWFHTTGETYRIDRYDKTGGLRGVYVYPGEPAAVTEADLEAFLARMRGARSEPSTRERLLRRTPLPERMPAYSGLVIDRDGGVWAKPHPGVTSKNCWHVYQVEPLVFAEACLPDGFEVFEVGGDWVLGVERDSLDVERVAVYRLSK